MLEVEGHPRGTIGFGGDSETEHTDPIAGPARMWRRSQVMSMLREAHWLCQRGTLLLNFRVIWKAARAV